MADKFPEERTIVLRKPVQLGDVTYAELKLREPTGLEMQQWDGQIGATADVTAIAVVSGVPRPAVEMIGSRDIVEAARYLALFL
jgi:hypothetical protein